MKPIKNIIKLSGINQASWLNPLFMALFPAALLIYLQPIKFSQFLFEEYLNQDDVTIIFEDVDKHGKSEKIVYANEEAEGHAHIKYYNDKNQYIDQYNFKHPIAKYRNKLKPYSVDLTKDGSKDFIFFTQHEDSLFIDAFDYKNEVKVINSRFITTIGGFNNHGDYTLNTIGDYDVNHDAVPEFYFSVASGFAWNPRRIFRYDFANDSLIASINTGAGYLPGIICKNKDSMMLGIGSSAHGNIRPDYPFAYHDSTTWIFFFDKDLKLKFPPKNYGVNPSGIEKPLCYGDYIYYLFASNNAQYENKLFKMNWQGAIEDSLEFDFYVSKKFSQVTVDGERCFYIQNLDARKYMRFDFEKFELLETEQLDIGKKEQLLYEEDLNNDGKVELITINPVTKNLTVFNHNLKKENTLNLNKYTRFISSHYSEERGLGELAICGDNFSVVYRYTENPYYAYKYFLWIAIYLLSALFMSIVLFLQNQRTFRQQKMEKQLADLQLQNLRNQLDPHFTYNVLNTIGSAIYKEDKNAAYDLFQRFTRIIRTSLMSSDKVFLTLKEEIQFTQDYLEFQKLRFKDRFDYSLEVAPEFKQKYIRFPKMLIQAYAENAVKHAFYDQKENGLITIKITGENKQAKIIIEDNGIGIKSSKKLKATSGTQKGEKLLEAQIKQINKLYKTDYSIEITDKKGIDAMSSGTKVVISFTK